MEEYTLHELHLSGNCYKVRLTAALVQKPLRLIEYGIFDGRTRSPEFLATINANGRVPVLQINNDTFLPESNAAIYYLATATPLIPTDRLEHAQMLQWMFFEQYSHEPNIATLRFMTTFQGLDNLSEEQRASMPGRRTRGEAALKVMDAHLAGREFFVGARLSLADVALYGYTHVAHEAEFDMEQTPNVKAWLERVAQQPRFVTMQAR